MSAPVKVRAELVRSEVEASIEGAGTSWELRLVIRVGGKEAAEAYLSPAAAEAFARELYLQVVPPLGP